MLPSKVPVASYKRTSIRKSPYGYWVVTWGPARKTEPFPKGATAIRAVENAIKRNHARKILNDLHSAHVRGTRAHRLRQRLAVRDGPLCHYCTKHLDIEKRTVDHVVPKSLGGPSSLDNYVLACGNCNRKKGQSVHPNHCAFCANACDMYWNEDLVIGLDTVP